MANSTKQSSKKTSSNVLLFGSMNYKLMIIALLITAGFVLMSGGGAELSGEANTAETFDSSIYSFQRIILAPISLYWVLLWKFSPSFTKPLNLRLKPDLFPWLKP